MFQPGFKPFNEYKFSKSYCSAKCFSKTGYCLVHKVKDVLPSNYFLSFFSAAAYTTWQISRFGKCTTLSNTTGSTVKTEHRKTLLLYSLQHICSSGIDPPSYPFCLQVGEGIRPSTSYRQRQWLYFQLHNT